MIPTSMYIDIQSNENKMNCELIPTYDTPALRQTGSSNLTGQKTLSTTCQTYMKLVTKYQVPGKMQRTMCIYKCMLNVYKNQQNRQGGSWNLMGTNTFPIIWGSYMKLVTKYQISAINSCWEKCDEKCACMFNAYKSN